jgi:hypothetical protein
VNSKEHMVVTEKRLLAFVYRRLGSTIRWDKGDGCLEEPGSGEGWTDGEARVIDVSDKIIRIAVFDQEALDGDEPDCDVAERKADELFRLRFPAFFLAEAE